MDHAPDLIEYDRHGGWIFVGKKGFSATSDDAGNITLNLGNLRKLGSELWRHGWNAHAREVSDMLGKMGKEMVK